MDNKIKPLDFDKFSSQVKASSNKTLDCKKFFTKDILDIQKYAIGPYFWFIPDNVNMTIADSSDNIDKLTSFKKDEWKQHYPEFLSIVMHPKDWQYFLGCVTFMLDFLEKVKLKERHRYRFNIYVRIKNKNQEYRWMVIQFPKIIYNDQGQGISSLIVVTDLSYFEIVNQPIMTLVDTTNNRIPFYKDCLSKNRKEINFAHITKREQEVLALIIKGLNSPEISNALFISYHTVENHKRNLRFKTHSKTTAELVFKVLKNNLI